MSLGFYRTELLYGTIYVYNRTEEWRVLKAVVAVIKKRSAKNDS
jgi:hypothetical protein